jgi:predicted membrane protein
MGGCRLDLRDAEIPGRRLDIIAVSVMGGVRIVVPEGVQVDVDGIAVMGGKRVDVADVPAHPGTPVIHVHVVTVMGGVKVVSRPPRELKPPTG